MTADDLSAHDARLSELWLADVPTRDIAKELGLTLDQVRGRARRLDLPQRYRYGPDGKRKPDNQRKPSQVYTKPKPDPALPARDRVAARRCLGCSRAFQSEWCGNRLCRSCLARDTFNGRARL